MKTASEILLELEQCDCTDGYVRHWTGLLFTSGIHTLAESAGAYWLIDVIASYQTRALHESCGGFQLWEIVVDTQKHTAVVTCRDDSTSPAVVTQHIEHTDFPLARLKMYVEGPRGQAVLLLPSEH